MSYVVPSVLVYEQLASAGVANSTPDLETCIIGPCYNVLAYTPGSTTSLVQTAALSANSATGSMTSGSAVLTLTTQSPFQTGANVIVPGAGASGAALSANVLSISGYAVTLDTSASTTVSNVTVTQTGTIADNQVPNTFVLPGQLPGQVIDATTIQVYLNSTLVETLATQFQGLSGSATITVAPATSPCAATTGSDQLTGVTDAYLFTVGDPVVVTGAGASGANLTSTITAIVGETVTVAAQAGTTAGSATITKQAISNINSNTSTLRMEVGDEVELFYTNTSSVAETFTTTLVSIVNLTGTIETLGVADMLPADLSATTTLAASASAAATSITVASQTGFAVGQEIVIRGAGAGGSDLYTTIGAISTTSGVQFTGLSPAIATAVTSGTAVIGVSNFTLRTRKSYNNLLLPQVYNSNTNYNDSSVGTTGELTIEPEPQVSYGTVISAAVNIAYNALRTDLSATIQNITSVDDIEGVLGAISNLNPLALGVQLALANTTTSINALAVSSDDLVGFTSALETLENATMYALVPLTQDQSILTAFQEHVDQMSTPQMAAWRMALVNTAIPTTQNIGPYSSTLVNSNSGNNTITLVQGKYVLTASNATFLSDGVNPGDIVNITAGTGSPSPIGTAEVQQVVSNQQIVIASLGTATAVSYYVSRNLTKAQQAAAVAAQSSTWNDERMVHVQPDICGINVNGTVQNLPGYYLACTLGGLIAGLPVQQGLTNIAVAGITNLSDSNFYFTRSQLDSMAAAGTCLLVQQTQTSTPYVRHQLTTNMTVLNYREISLVKNLDYLAYYFVSILKGFIGTWNITKDSLNTLRQTITSGGNLLMGQSLPKVGPPLVSFNIASLAQDTTEPDMVDCTLNVALADPLNYISLYLIV
jgi:hypothetical protein